MRVPFLLFLFITGATAQVALPDAPAKKVFESTCSACHDVGTALGSRHTRAGWGSLIDSMAARGAQGSDKDFADIAEYLAKYFGVVNVNSATAGEIAEVLEISAASAEAIVQQREQGTLTSLDAVKKIPGIDSAALDAKKDRIAFR